MSQILIGDAKGQHVSINVMYREREDAYDADDGNWLVTQMSVRAGAWFGSYSATRQPSTRCRIQRSVFVARTRTDDPKFATIERLRPTS